MQKDSKVIAIWILAVVLVVVGILYITELNKPDSVDSFAEELRIQRQNVEAACADVSTDDKRDKCVSALKDVEGAIKTIK
jgi:hypothetical protein